MSNPVLYISTICFLYDYFSFVDRTYVWLLPWIQLRLAKAARKQSLTLLSIMFPRLLYRGKIGKNTASSSIELSNCSAPAKKKRQFITGRVGSISKHMDTRPTKSFEDATIKVTAIVPRY